MNTGNVQHISCETVEGIIGAVPMRIGILLDHPSPHMTAMLDALSECEDCQCYIIYLDGSAPGRTWGAPLSDLPHKFVSGFHWPGGVRINPGIHRVLKSARVDAWVLSTCYTSPTTLIAAAWLERNRIPWVYVNEPPQPRPSLFTAFKQPLLSYLLNRAWGIAGTGEKAEEMYRKIAPEGKPTTSIPYYIELEPFYSLPLVRQLSDKDPVQFVTSCQMIRRKGVDILLRACELLPSSGWTLTLAGDGPLRSNLERDFGTRWDTSRVRFIGHVPYEERASIFDGKHVFVFPSRWDGWGMVVPEALAAGLPVISGEGVMSAHDFIRDGENGFITPSEDPHALAQRMAFFIEHHDAIPKMSLAARQSLKLYRADIGADKLLAFLKRIREDSKGSKRTTSMRLAKKAVPDNWECLTSPLNAPLRLLLNLRRTAKNCFISTALKTRPRTSPTGDRILVYHLVLREDKERFEEHLNFLSDNFELCTVSELLSFHNQRPANGNYRAAISFDDGFRILMEDCLEICQDRGVRATYYVPTGFVQLSQSPELAAEYSLRAHYYNLPLEPMRKEDLRLLASLGHEIGSHGKSHTKFAFLSRQAAHRELTSSMEQIRGWTGKMPKGFAYPYGEVNSSLGQPREWVREAGYQYAVTLKRGPVTKEADPFQIPREHVEGNWRVKDLRYFLLGC